MFLKTFDSKGSDLNPSYYIWPHVSTYLIFTNNFENTNSLILYYDDGAQALYQLVIVFGIMFFGEKIFDIDSGRYAGQYN